jgi:Histidine kinase-, DNA gyrase B-, and HSP90-like ATPase
MRNGPMIGAAPGLAAHRRRIRICTHASYANNAARRKTGRASVLDLISAKAGRLLSVTETDIEQRKAIAGLGDDDIPCIALRITSLKSMIEQRADHYTVGFFDHLVRIRRPRTLCSARVLDQAKQRKRDRSRRRTRRQRGRGEGVGLGLSIARAIVAAHHGTIGFSTTEGKGTTFHFGLPISRRGSNARARVPGTWRAPAVSAGRP